MRSKVLVTVIKKLSTHDLYGEHAPVHATFEDSCPRCEVGDQWIVPEDGSCPEGFCPWAYADIQRDITHLRFGGDYPFLAESGMAIQCCTDGLRPVFFQLERMP
ncbi:MAG: TIGR04076 family protein [Dehalococcoidia bacterium]|nr:TIGR04076 family protein [Dehalococcoidia bacterium]